MRDNRGAMIGDDDNIPAIGEGEMTDGGGSGGSGHRGTGLMAGEGYIAAFFGFCQGQMPLDRDRRKRRHAKLAGPRIFRLHVAAFCSRGALRLAPAR